MDHDHAIPVVLRAVATVSLSGPLSLQGRQAGRGLELWASSDDIHLELVDDGSSASESYHHYRPWLDASVDIVLGPYGSGLVRKVAPLVTGREVLLWNHGGAADDLARPLLVSLPAPASTYFHGSVELADEMGIEELVVASGSGRFASAVASGADRRASELGMASRRIRASEVAAARGLTGRAVLVVGDFDGDVANVACIRARHDPGLLGCVAAGLEEFGSRLGAAAEQVVGPVQWIPQPGISETGPNGSDFAARYEAEFGESPGYVAAQAAAAGFLAVEATRRGYDHDQIRDWTTSTLLGSFALDNAWRQVGLTPVTIQWWGGRRVVARLSG